MSKIIFVIGANATGKTFFIHHKFSESEYHILNIYDYQVKFLEEAGHSISMKEQMSLLLKAQHTIIDDAVTFLKRNENVVMEHTLFKAKRRVAYIDQIRENVNAEIEIYVMRPSESTWKERIQKREMNENVLHQAEDLEFPNPAEGFNAIYEVTDEGIRFRMDTPDNSILRNSRAELAEEQEQLLREKQKKEARQALLESMNTRKFWHYCEVCGKKAYLTAEEAYGLGWDYPPENGNIRPVAMCKEVRRL